MVMLIVVSSDLGPEPGGRLSSSLRSTVSFSGELPDDPAQEHHLSDNFRRIESINPAKSKLVMEGESWTEKPKRMRKNCENSEMSCYVVKSAESLTILQRKGVERVPIRRSDP